MCNFEIRSQIFSYNNKKVKRKYHEDMNKKIKKLQISFIDYSNAIGLNIPFKVQRLLDSVIFVRELKQNGSVQYKTFLKKHKKYSRIVKKDGQDDITNR